jgi:hypothetical protein
VHKTILIVDARYKNQKASNEIEKVVQKQTGEYEILALTPYSYYILDQIGLKYITFHDLISIDDFRSKVLKKYEKFSSLILEFKEYSYLMIEFAPIITYQSYSSVLCKFLKKNSNFGGDAIYITDTKKVSQTVFNIKSNENGAIHYFSYISRTVYIGQKDLTFYLGKKIENYIILISRKNLFLEIINKIRNVPKLHYDNIFFNDFFAALPRKKVKPLLLNNYDEFKEKLWIQIDKSSFSDYIKIRFEEVVKQLDESIYRYKSLREINIEPMTYISSLDIMCRALLYRQNNIPVIIFQHGSNIHNNMFLKYGDVYYSDINLSYNEYSNKLYKKLGSRSAKVVGSILFNKNLCKTSEKFDYVYIPYCSNYEYSINRIDDTSELSIGGFSNYERHKYIIELFGQSFPDKKICIKLQAGTVLNQLYVPLVELSMKYSNVYIEEFTPLQEIISQSKYIISDYFSSDFTNIRIHKCKGIILLNQDEIIDASIKHDMDKMFVRCDDIRKVEALISNSDEIFKNRKIESKIIENYASKVCNTKNIVNSIYKKAYLDAE